MKIAIYTIAKNEEKFTDRFFASAADADGIFVLDTGSTDATVEKLRGLGAVVDVQHVVPWRFDVARNLSLQMVPDDYDVCVCIDLDEILTAGWRKKIEDSFTADAACLRYRYTWNHTATGEADTTFWYDKIHRRHGFQWKGPVHEVLVNTTGQEYRVDICDAILVEHFPDSEKPRTQYLPLLELATAEDPLNDRNSHYLGREYFFHGKLEESEKELIRHLSLPTATWGAERAESMAILADVCAATGRPAESLCWLRKACAEAPDQREPWVRLANHYYAARNHPAAYHCCLEALTIVERPRSYITKAFAWGALPYDILSVCAWEMGLKDVAANNVLIAAQLSPEDPRILNNYRIMTADRMNEDRA